MSNKNLNWGPRTLGSLLRPEVQREALARFNNRYTWEFTPKWALRPMPNGQHYKPQFRSDAEWLSFTVFYTNKDGTLSERHTNCDSNPTWPDGEI
ncbi:MAG: hypothetical protein ACHQU0_03735 [Candidatus Paceibacteria bacterium]